MGEPHKSYFLGMKEASALWIEAPRTAALRPSPLAPPGPEEALVRTLWSAVSRGTERLVFEGRGAALAMGAHARAVSGGRLSPFR